MILFVGEFRLEGKIHWYGLERWRVDYRLLRFWRGANWRELVYLEYLLQFVRDDEIRIVIIVHPHSDLA
jgi:hypothetical protein